jgi:hypothetical protein
VGVILHHILKLAEKYKVFSSFFAFGSGTDFSFTPLLVGKLPVVYGKKSKLEPAMYTAPQMSYTIVGP